MKTRILRRQLHHLAHNVDRFRQPQRFERRQVLVILQDVAIANYGLFDKRMLKTDEDEEDHAFFRKNVDVLRISVRTEHFRYPPASRSHSAIVFC